MTRVLGPAVLLAMAAAVAAQEQSGPATVFRATSDTVPVYATVTDRADRLVSGLTRDQFTVRDNGKPQPLTLFDNSPQPIRLVVLIDVSGSMYGNLPIIRAAGAELFSRLGPADQATVGTLGDDIAINPDFTRDERALVARLPDRIREDAPTPLWRAILQGMDLFGDAEGRRVVLVISDGKDSRTGGFGQKFVGSFEVLDRAHRDNIMMYAVAMRSRLRPGAGGSLARSLGENFPDPEFGSAAVETGGGYVEIGPRDDLATTFARIADELHSQYLLGFRPPAADGKRHEVEVRVADGRMQVRARKTYLAPRAAR